jgi:formylmethanofuran dehydrogenase subunit E-like metal-binding protein
MNTTTKTEIEYLTGAEFRYSVKQALADAGVTPAATAKNKIVNIEESYNDTEFTIRYSYGWLSETEIQTTLWMQLKIERALTLAGFEMMNPQDTLITWRKAAN